MTLRAKPDKKQEKQRIREALLHAALRLGAEQGFASLGLRGVAREAQIAPTSFYRHFQDMEALALGIVNDKVEPLVRTWADALPGGQAAPTELVAALVESVDSQPALTRFIVAERVGCSAALREALRAALAVVSARLLDSVPGSQRDKTPELVGLADLFVVVLVESAAQLLDAQLPRGGLPAAILRRMTTVLTLVRSSSQSHA